MSRFLYNAFSFYTRITHHPSPIFKSNPDVLVLHASKFSLRFFSTTSTKPPLPRPGDYLEPNASESVQMDTGFPSEQDVSTPDLIAMVDKYLRGDEKLLPDITDAIIRRNLHGGHEQSDAEMMDDLKKIKPVFDPQKLRANIESTVKTDSGDEDEYIWNLNKFAYDHSMKHDPTFHVIPEKLSNPWLKAFGKKDINMLPAEIKNAAINKMEEVTDMVGKGEISEEVGDEMFNEFTNKLAAEYIQSQVDGGEHPVEADLKSKEERTQREGGEGPTLKWVMRHQLGLTVGPGHRDNNRVKMVINVNDLGLNKFERHRLLALAATRYTPSNGKLSITCTRFDHRVENKKECYRILVALMDEARKANKLVEEARKSVIRERLRNDPIFMERLRAKITKRLESSNPLPAT